ERGELVLPFGTEKGITKYVDSFLNTFLRGDPAQPETSLYEWEISPCKDSNLKDCGIGSQAWRVLPGGEFRVPNLKTPLHNAVVNMQDSLSWNFVPFASRYVVRLLDISEDGTGSRDIFVPGNPKLSLGQIWKFLRFDTSYAWMVAPCGGAPESKEFSGCENADGTTPWSQERVFRTTGTPPTGLTVSPIQDGKTALPTTFNWDDIPGAASYSLKIGEEEGLNVFRNIKGSQVTINYPALAPNASFPNAPFKWRVKTCADEQGLVCGNWSSAQPFLIATLKAPTLLQPLTDQKEFFATTEFAWTKDFGSNYFTYQLNFLKPSAEEKSSSCQTPNPVEEGLPEKNSASIRLRCLGEYEFNIRACIDKDCEASGPQTTQLLNVESFKGSGGGLIPCDANNDNPATTEDERKPCELKHLILLVRNLVDFALWKLSLVI
ncbi:MAG: hypothetical protein Q7K38_03670, partial [Candidatus Wildermuthbacteria bacterium]|nr:hypothetical protein [Candidatus Wildermuthbacteria bacterium]